MKKTTIRPDCCEIQMVFLPPPSRLSVMASPTSRRPWLLTQSRRFWPSAARVELSDCILSLSIKLLYVVLAFGDSSGWLHPLEAAAGKWMDVCVESTVQCIFSAVERVFCSVLSPLWICACGVRGKEIYRIIKMQMQPQLSRAVEAVPFSLYLFIYLFCNMRTFTQTGTQQLAMKRAPRGVAELLRTPATFCLRLLLQVLHVFSCLSHNLCQLITVWWRAVHLVVLSSHLFTVVAVTHTCSPALRRLEYIRRRWSRWEFESLKLRLATFSKDDGSLRVWRPRNFTQN